MKKTFVLLLSLFIAFSVSACKTTLVDVGDQLDEKTAVYTNEDIKQYKSELGFNVKLDEKAFSHTFENNKEKFINLTEEEQKSPIYIAVQLFKDTDAKELAESLVLQSGKDDVSVKDTYFGGDGKLMNGVYYTKKANDIEQIFSFHTVDTPKGAMLIEAVGYVDQPKSADVNMEEFFATFFVD